MERRLVELAQQGDQKAFAEIAHVITPRLLGISQRILRDYHRAEDATQQALILLWRKLPKLSDPEHFDAWAYRVVVNVCYAEARRHRPGSEGLHLLEADAVIDDGVLSIAERDMLDRAFVRLPTEQRAVLVLQYYLDLGLPEIAKLLDVPLGTVKSRASSGRQALRAAIEADARPGARRWTA
jgi:RNA polymerase sigma-70 factor (ECF subfamily)